MGIGGYQDVIASLRMYFESCRLSQPFCTMTSTSTFSLQPGGIRWGEGQSRRRNGEYERTKKETRWTGQKRAWRTEIAAKRGGGGLKPSTQPRQNWHKDGSYLAQLSADRRVGSWDTETTAGLQQERHLGRSRMAADDKPPPTMGCWGAAWSRVIFLAICCVSAIGVLAPTSMGSARRWWATDGNDHYRILVCA